ncbi:MAG: hypothetical protein MJ078_01520, partial [Clostridia bacterium]|nr:hypothetical protein [Clostridia bacterium]
TALDLLPAFLAVTLITGGSPLSASVFYFLCLGVDFYAQSIMFFTELALSAGLSQQVKVLVSVLLCYAAVLPAAAVVAVGMLSGNTLLFLPIASLCLIAVGGAFFALTPLFLERGRK